MPFTDLWSPTVEELHEATELEKMALVNKVIDLASSDSQFAQKLKVALALILTAGNEEVPPEEPPPEIP